ncbi:MAG: T9SS type A sorting domain-containing protein [Sediminibacterium sp.]
MRRKILLSIFVCLLTVLLVTKSFGQAPTITSFSPSSGPVGTLVTVTGTNLNSPTSFTIGGVSAIVVSNTGTQLVGMVMPGAVSGNVVFNAALGNATGSGTFTVKNTAYPSLQQGNKLFDASILNSQQGRAVAISADGNTAIIGVFDNSYGGAVIYVRNGNSWTKQSGLLSIPEGQLMGWSVALSADGNTAVMANISSDSKKLGAVVFVRNSGIWTQQGNKIEVDGITRFAGVPLSISGDGNTIMFGYSVNLSNTSVEWGVYKRANNSWSLESIIPINGLSGSSIYWNVALSSDGQTVVFGQSGEGIWFFEKNGNVWINQGGKIKPNGSANFDTYLSISADGNTALIGDFIGYNGPDYSIGNAYIYNRNAGNWSQTAKLFVENNVEVFGIYTALSADGKTAIIQGNRNVNNVRTGGNWIFTNKNGIWTNEGMKFSSSIPFGNVKETIAISSDGKTAIMGVPDEDGGGAYIYVADPLVDAGEVSGGSSGGLESKSLGNAVVKRVYTKAQTNLNGPDDYNKMQKVIRRSLNQQTTGIGSISELKLSNMMPDISSFGLIAYNSTPKDIISITNAKEVLSTDFTSNKQCKAVAFATKTKEELYDHTKPICDRLKGATLDKLESIKIYGFEFIQYTLHNDKGQLEYATSFSVGTKTGRPDLTIQSSWLLTDYVNEENMFNFQLWAATPELVSAMVADVLNKLQAVAPIKSISKTLIPNTYILSGKRESTNLNLVLANTGNSNSGYFLVEDKSNEEATIINSRKVPFTVSANGKSSVSIPMSDNFESTITMYVNNAIRDVVYMSDGSWYADYNKATTSVSVFNVTNDTKRVFTADEYPVFRNVALKAVSNDYVSIVKLMKGGGMEVDLSAYRGLKITASGGHSLHIVLVKNSIVNWKDQYFVDIPLEQNQKDYFVSLDKFISLASQNKLKANDISAIVFSVETSNGATNVVNTTLSNISFTKEDLNYLASLELKEIQLFPNPVTTNRFSCNFASSKSTTLTLRITDANGRLIQSQQVNAIKGNNSIPVNISFNNPGIHVVSLEGMNEKYQSKKLVVAKY